MDRVLQSSLQHGSCQSCSTSSLGSKTSLQQLYPQAPVRRNQQRRKGSLQCQAAMGIGFHRESGSSSSSLQEQSQIVIPKSAYGLSTRQMAAMGITDPDVVQRTGPQHPVRAWHKRHLPVNNGLTVILGKLDDGVAGSECDRAVHRGL